MEELVISRLRRSEAKCTGYDIENADAVDDGALLICMMNGRVSVSTSTRTRS
jgi:hypothetical protein